MQSFSVHQTCFCQLPFFDTRPNLRDQAQKPMNFSIPRHFHVSPSYPMAIFGRLGTSSRCTSFRWPRHKAPTWVAPAVSNSETFKIPATWPPSLVPGGQGGKVGEPKNTNLACFFFQENLFWKGRNDRINSFFWCESVMMSCDIIALVPLWISLCRTSPRLDFYFTTVSQHIFIWHMTVGKQGSQKSMLHGISNMISLNSIVAFPRSTCLLTLWISLRNEILSLFIWRISGDTEAFTRFHHLKCCSQQSGWMRMNMFHVSNNVHGYNSPNPIRSPVMCECVFPTMFHLSTKPVFCLTSMLLRRSITGCFKQPSLKPTAFAPQKKVGIFRMIKTCQ